MQTVHPQCHQVPYPIGLLLSDCWLFLLLGRPFGPRQDLGVVTGLRQDPGTPGPCEGHVGGYLLLGHT